MQWLDFTKCKFDHSLHAIKEARLTIAPTWVDVKNCEMLENSHAPDACKGAAFTTSGH